MQKIANIDNNPIVQHNLDVIYKNLTNHQKCYLRDRLIFESLERMKILNTDQIAILFFENRLKVAQRRLEKLYSKKKVKRIQIAINQPLCYYSINSKELKQVEHTVMTNWMYIWFLLNLKQYESIFHFSYEQQNEIFRYDGLIAIENKFTKEIKFYFIEVDLSNNKFDKVEKYNRFYQDRLYEKEWWLEYVNRFPAIVVLTHRERVVKNKIKENNTSNLEFIVYEMGLIDSLRGLVK